MAIRLKVLRLIQVPEVFVAVVFLCLVQDRPAFE